MSVPGSIVLVGITLALANGIVFGAAMRWRALWILAGWIVLLGSAFLIGLMG